LKNRKEIGGFSLEMTNPETPDLSLGDTSAGAYRALFQTMENKLQYENEFYDIGNC
jgi:hypothetical protein